MRFDPDGHCLTPKDPTRTTDPTHPSTLSDPMLVGSHACVSDVLSLRPKYAYARSLGLRGVGPFTFTDTGDPAMYEAFDAFLL